MRVKSVVASAVVAVEVVMLVEVWAKPGLAQSAALKPSKAVRNRRRWTMVLVCFLQRACRRVQAELLRSRREEQGAMALWSIRADLLALPSLRPRQIGKSHATRM
jgi:hypothetical protein